MVSSVANDLKIYNLNGTTYTNIPINFEFPFSGHPIIKDIDSDGDLEVFVGSTNGMIGIDIKDINGNTEGYWNQFRNNITRTGYIESDQILHTINPELLSDFILFSPYPNPFNPSTKITYYLPEPSDIELLVYDITGRQVDVLKKQIMSAGYHSIDWEPNLAS